MFKNIIMKIFKKSTENNRIVITNVVFAFFIKGGAFILTLFTMPAYIDYFNNDTTLGIWFTISSILGWILNFDLGIGNGLRNHLTVAITQKNNVEAKKYISSAYVSIGCICFIISIIFIGALPFFQWNEILNIEQAIISRESIMMALAISGIGIALQLFLKLIQSIVYALQISSVNNLLSLITSVITLLLVLIVPSKDNNTNIVAMSIIHLLAVNVPLIVTTIIIFSKKKMREMIPSLKFIDLQHIKNVVKLGTSFFAVQITHMILLGTNEYLITFLCGNENVVEYRIYYQIFALGGTLFSLALTPVWSVITKAMAQKDYTWISKLYSRAFGLVGLGAIGEFAIIAVLPFIFKLWLKANAPQVNYIYATVCAIFGIIFIINSLTSTIANGLGLLKTQLITFTLGIIIKFAIVKILVNYFGSWIGVQMACNISMLPFCIAQPIVLNKYIKNKIRGVK